MRTAILTMIMIPMLLSGCGDKASREQINPGKTTYYFIRHAEKDRSDKNNKDPELTEKGIVRSEHWANYFDTVHLDAVYSTDYLRTKQTASPTAGRKQLPILSYDPKDLYNQTFKLETEGKSVLIVGHSNTTPAFVNSIIGSEKYPDMDDADNESLYIVTVSTEGMDHRVEKIKLPEKDED